jgi:hypothetical protein
MRGCNAIMSWDDLRRARLGRDSISSANSSSAQNPVAIRIDMYSVRLEEGMAISYARPTNEGRILILNFRPILRGSTYAY